MVGSEKSRLLRVTRMTQHARLSTLATDSSGQLDVFRHDGDSLGVDGAQVRVFEKTDQVCLASLLQGHDGRALEAQVGLEVLCDFTDQALEGQLADEQLGALLVTTDLTKSDGAGPVAMRLLHSTGSRCAFAGGLGRQLLPRGLATGRLTSCLLGTRHGNYASSHCKCVRFEKRAQLLLCRGRAFGGRPVLVSDWLPLVGGVSFEPLPVL